MFIRYLSFVLGGGAWLIAHRAEERRRFKAVLCTQPRTYQQVHEDRKRAEKEGTAIIPTAPADPEQQEENKVLDGFFLVCVLLKSYFFFSKEPATSN